MVTKPREMRRHKMMMLEQLIDKRILKIKNCIELNNAPNRNLGYLKQNQDFGAKKNSRT